MIELTGEIPARARQWRNDPRVWKWCRQHTLISEREQILWLQKITDDPTIKMFGISADGVSVGVCGFTSIDNRNRSAEFSIYIGPEHQGMGHGKEALKELLRHGFQDFGFRRIWGEVFEGNPALKSFLSVGFQVEGELRSTYWNKGRWINSTVIGVLDYEWK